MRKKIAILLLTFVSAFVLFGCTMLPASVETGIGPEEYTEIRNTEATKKENESLKNELDILKTEMEKMEKDYLELAKNNETVISKLEEAETKLDILGNDGIPKFNSEKTDNNSIVAYLNNSKSVLDKSLRGIEIIESTDESKVLFYTTGYGDSFNQIFIWNIGESEPLLVDGAAFAKNGSFEMISSRFLLIDTGNNEEFKILDTDSEKIINNFNTKQEPYLISDTATFILQKPDTGTFVLYDFINSKEQEIDLDYKNKYTSFNVDETKSEVTFSGIYTDEHETSYSVVAVMNLDKIKEKYGIVNLEEAIKKIENDAEEMGLIETNEPIETEGTV